MVGVQVGFELVGNGAFKSSFMRIGVTEEFKSEGRGWASGGPGDRP